MAAPEARPRKKQKGYSLPPDLIKAVRHAATDADVPESEFVERALRDAVSRQPSPPADMLSCPG